MNVLLFGGTGFIGSAFLEKLLENGDHVTLVSRSKFSNSSNKQQLTNILLDEFLNSPNISSFDVCFFLISSLTPALAEEQLDVAMSSDFKLLSSVLKKVEEKTKFVFVSSGGTVYGEMQGDRPFSETDTVHPWNKYGNYKRELEKILEADSLLRERPIFVLRLSNPYGPWPLQKDPFGFINRTIQSGIAGRAIKVYGSYDIVRDFIHISDVVLALMKIKDLSLSGYHIYNIGSGLGYTLSEVIEIIGRQITIDVQLASFRGFDIQKNVLDINKMKSTSFWKPEISIEQGIKQTIQWWRNSKPNE